MRYLGEGFSKSYLATIGADFATKHLDSEGMQVAQIWDLAGQPRFSVVREGYYRGTKGAILVFDISRPETYYSIPKWIEELMDSMDLEEPIPLVLVGNKGDLREESSEFVSVEQAQEYAQALTNWAELEIPYIESSAKTGLNVDHIFQSIVSNIALREGTAFQGF
jgi:small GTP-binding protein